MGVNVNRTAKVAITAVSRVKPGIDDATRQLRTFQREQARSAKQADREAKKKKKEDEKARAKLKDKAGGLAGDVAGGFGTALGFDAAGGAMGMIGDVANFERALTRFQIVAGKTPAQMADLRKSILDVSNATGIAASEVLSGASTYVDLTGDVGGAVTAMTTFARVAQASGSSVSDVATAAAAMQDAMKLDPKQFEAAFGGLISQGKAGAVNLKDFAGELSSLMPKFARFKGEMGMDGVMQLGAAFQVARHGFGDASEAATGLESLMGALAKKAGDFEAVGVKIFDVAKDGTKTFRNLHDIVVDIGKSKLAKDPEALAEAFGRKEAEATYNQLARLPDLYNQMIDAGKDVGTVQRDFDTYMDSSAGKIEQAWTKVKNAVATALTPELIQKFANAISDAADKITPLVEGLGKVGGYLAGLYGVGQKISSTLFGDEPKTFNKEDIALVQSHGFKMGADNSDDAMHQRLAGAQSRMADVTSFDDAAKNIMGAEIDDRVTPKSIERAIAAAFSSKSYGEGRIGEEQAGRAYLKNAGIDDAKLLEMQTAAVQKSLGPLAQAVAAAVRDGMAGAKVAVGAEPVQKAAANSKTHRRGQH